jgi:hypothetical protein
MYRLNLELEIEWFHETVFFIIHNNAMDQGCKDNEEKCMINSTDLFSPASNVHFTVYAAGYKMN